MARGAPKQVLLAFKRLPLPAFNEKRIAGIVHESIA
jgi:hypothetical protein